MPPSPQKSPGDGKVDSYQRVVNGKVINVGGYAKKSTTSTRAVQAARRLPGRPRISAQPGSYTNGRDIPGVVSRPVPTPPALAKAPNQQPDQQPDQQPEENPDEASR